MAVRTLSLIEPEILSVEKSRTKKDLYSDIESVNYWSMLSDRESKYDWISLVERSISVIIKDKMSEVSYYNLKDVIERFVDENLIILENSSEFTFGNYMLYIWMGYTEEDLASNPDLQLFADELQECYDNVEENNPEKMYINITTLVMTRYLEAVVDFMVENSQDVINLFHCLYVQHTDPRFAMFRYENVTENLIPIQPSLNGLTVDRLKIDLGGFIKTKYSQQPSLENGVLQLLAGSSNVIVLDEYNISLANIIRKTLGETKTDSDKDLFFTFEAIQKRLKTNKDKTWTVAIVLDSLNEAISFFYS